MRLKKAWIDFHDVIEVELRTGELTGIKAADKAARRWWLCSTFSSIARRNQVSPEHIEAADRLVAWLFNVPESKKKLSKAQKALLNIDTGRFLDIKRLE